MFSALCAPGSVDGDSVQFRALGFGDIGRQLVQLAQNDRCDFGDALFERSLFLGHRGILLIRQ